MIKKMLLALRVSAVVMAGLAQAGTMEAGQFTITGEIITARVPTCTMTVEGQASSNIVLDPVMLDAVNDSPSAFKPFTLKFINCPTSIGTSTQLTLSGARQGETHAFQNMAAPEGRVAVASGAGVQIQESTGGTPMIPGVINEQTYDVRGHHFNVPLQAGIIRTDATMPAGPGLVKAVPTVEITYQ